jgi:hypothetical protein
MGAVRLGELGRKGVVDRRVVVRRGEERRTEVAVRREAVVRMVAVRRGEELRIGLVVGRHRRRVVGMPCSGYVDVRDQRERSSETMEVDAQNAVMMLR